MNSSTGWSRVRKGGRMAWTAVSALVVETAVVGLSLCPTLFAAGWLVARAPVPHAARLALLSLLVVPGYVVFALLLIVLSPLVMRIAGWRTPRDAELRIADLEWPLLSWGRYLLSAHIVRLFAGALLRTTPVWTFYHRLNGARLGRRVYVNSLGVMDDNLLEFGDDVVIGADVHLSGHTVEKGYLKTGAVRLGPGVTVGVGSVIGIGVEVGAGTQIGALSVVAKHRRLDAGAVYGGAPARRLDLADA